MGNKGSKTEVDHRRIYVGDVPEIEEDETGELRRRSKKSRQKRPSPESTPIDENIEVDPGVGDEFIEDDNPREIPSRPPSIRRPTIKPTKRRNSFAPKSTRKKKWFQRQGTSGGAQIFPSNEIKTSRYNLITFLPKNLFEQFRRIANFYFLCMAIIQLTVDSPVGWVTSVLPLVFVILVTALKQGYEDLLRHRADNEVNNRPVNVVLNGSLVTMESKQLRVGNVIKLDGEEPVPSDILVLGSSDEFMRCQITTANLDGETNLKMRYCPSGLPPLKTVEDFLKLDAVIECEQPNADLYVFNGSLLIPTNKMPVGRGSITSQNGSNTSSSIKAQGHSDFFQIPLTMDNMVLRGTKVKNTEYIYGLIVYTGVDTRLAQNSKKTHTKFSTIEKTVNHFLLVFVGILFSFVFICTGLHFVWLFSDDIENAWYLADGVKEVVNANYIFQHFASFLILFNYIIPISLYVTIEMQKFIGSMFFVWDEDLCCPVTGAPPLCNTSDLNEELGQIEYLFSDKTGTLTENIMEFRHCSINGRRYDFLNDSSLTYYNDESGRSEGGVVDIKGLTDLKKFLRTLALCHTVQLMPYRRPSFDIPIPKGKLVQKLRIGHANIEVFTENENERELEFQASSPDEKALLEACRKLGINYLGDKNDILTVALFGEEETFRRHFILEFDADRKCMSVIVENNKGEYWLLTKGAESTILPRGNTGPVPETMKHVLDFAKMGMRTLAIAERQLTKEEFDTFSIELKKAQRLLKNREQKMREVYSSVESNLNILGATGVEDQLQQGVPETLAALGAAGIKIWVLTGDKVETAVNVAISCGLITPASKQILVTNYKEVGRLSTRLQEIRSEMSPENNVTFVIDGESLQLALDSCADIFKEIAMQATRVVCSRMSPLQKAKVVSMVKHTESQPITAAVGDGANDVAMILEAHIGLAILGKEGRQAARSADFAIARFSFLAKTILVHGHWYYVRLAILAIYFFYKNLVLTMPQLYYCFFNAFSAQTIFDAFFLTFFNILYASVPIVAYGLQEQTHSAKKLLAFPHLYQEIRRNSILTWTKFILWNGLAVWHSSLIYFIIYFSLPFILPINDWPSFGTSVFCGVIAVTNLKLFADVRYMSWAVAICFAFSFLSFVVTTSIYAQVDLSFFGLDLGDLFKTYFRLMWTWGFWLSTILITFVCVIPAYGIEALKDTLSKIRKQKSKVLNAQSNSGGMFRIFESRPERVAVSSTTLTSYLSREQL